VTETTALGAAYLAGLQSGICPEPARFAETWVLERRFDPVMSPDLAATKYARWGRAVAATLMV
jgi:glycerol kinase